jgi:uncharacterized protein (DUF1697 family)
MKGYIALLRGINVGGHKKVLMAELRDLLTTSGLENVQTYIQSGNVIFKSSEENKRKLEAIIKEAINVHFGFEVPVLVRTKEEIKTILDDCPFPEAKKVLGYFIMLSEIPDRNLVEEATQKSYLDDDYVVLRDCIYLFCAKGYGRAKFKLNYFEEKLKVNATVRNYKTMVKLLSLSQTND